MTLVIESVWQKSDLSILDVIHPVSEIRAQAHSWKELVFKKEMWRLHYFLPCSCLIFVIRATDKCADFLWKLVPSAACNHLFILKLEKWKYRQQYRITVPELIGMAPVMYSWHYSACLISCLFFIKWRTREVIFLSVFDISTGNPIHLHQHHSIHIIVAGPSLHFSIY